MATSSVGSGLTRDVAGLAGAPPTGNSRPGATWKKRSSDVSERTTFASNLKRASFHTCRSSSVNPHVWAAELPAVTTRLRSVLLDQPSFGGSLGLSCAHASSSPAPNQATRHIAITLRCHHYITCPRPLSAQFTYGRPESSRHIVPCGDRHGRILTILLESWREPSVCVGRMARSVPATLRPCPFHSSSASFSARPWAARSTGPQVAARW